MNKFKFIANGKLPKKLKEKAQRRKAQEKALEDVLKESEYVLAKDRTWRSNQD